LTLSSATHRWLAALYACGFRGLLGRFGQRLRMPEGMRDEAVGAPAGTLSAVRTCEQKLGYVFREPKLLTAALTHASGAPYRLASNERLEFLGDAILGMIVCEMLFHRYPKHSEGDLTKIKSVVVSRQTCARIARRLALDEHLVLGKGMTSSHKLPTSLLAGVFESLVAAIYLDGGMAAVRVFVERTMTEEVDVAVDSEHGHNYKSLLQQLAQREYNSTPTYALVEERGPDHRKSFKVAARVGGHEYAAAWGANKKEAEQKAAYNALHALGGTVGEEDGRELTAEVLGPQAPADIAPADIAPACNAPAYDAPADNAPDVLSTERPTDASVAVKLPDWPATPIE
jgi:ribonuclease-3